jgi:hypothetical protein
MPEKDYSHRDVLDKLGLKPGHAVRAVGGGDKALLARVRERVGVALRAGGLVRAGQADVVLYWPRRADEITPTLAGLCQGIVDNGGIWVFTAKRGQRSASGMDYLNHADLIPLGLAAGLVDNKICSVSDTESAMRFVIRKKDRQA